MRNIKMTIMYDGTRYKGWQRLGGGITTESIQGMLESKLEDLLNEPIEIKGSGRTDQGVHALGQIANFKINKIINFEWLKSSLNHILPDDIKILQIESASQGFHSRYHARKKCYEYYIDNNEIPSVFARKYSGHIEEPLNVSKMIKGATYLVGQHDFKGFSSAMKDGRSTIKQIFLADVIERCEHPMLASTMESSQRQYLCIRLWGDGFLYNMVRIVTGTLIDIGLSKAEPEIIKEILQTGDRQLAGATMCSQGLFLKTVEY